jgi:hypothetical protein
MEGSSRRSFLLSVGAVAAASAARPLFGISEALKSPFRIAVINDEISQDFDHACYVASHDFGMSWIELRSMWGKNTMDLSAAQIDEAQKILLKYNLQVTDIASPLFKTDWPGAPTSPYGSKGDMHGAAEATFKQQDEILERSIALARQFKTGKVRCFDFWRLDDVAPIARRSMRSCARPPRPPASRACCWCWRTSLPATPPRAAKPRGR